MRTWNDSERGALVTDQARNEFIVQDVMHAVQSGRSPLLLTGRTDHPRQPESALAGKVRNVIVLKGGMGRKQRRSVRELVAGVPDGEQRLILATGSYIGEGFDDARLDTVFLRCRSHGGVRFNNTSDDSIGSTITSVSSRSL
jgi:hypothetical protein